MQSDVGNRLRHLAERSNWTVADMAERTGIPKRTLDKYMAREGASLPGFDALCALSKGLGVSLDWLVFGAEFASKGAELLVERAAYEVVKTVIETILKYDADGVKLIEGGRLLNSLPEEGGFNLASKASEIATEMVQSGITIGELLTWHTQKKDRVWELVMDKFEAMKEGRYSPTPL